MKNKKIAIVAIVSLVIIALFYFLFLRKPDKTSKKIDPGFTSYISGFTSGTISNQSSIRIILTDGVPEIENNSEVQKGLISFSPGIKGQTIWINNRTIEFRPETRLKSGERYSVTFKLGKLKVVPEKFEVFKFDFQVIKLSFSTSITGIKPYVKTDLERQKLSGVVYTADYADENEIKDLLEAKQNGKNLSVIWESATDGKTHSFQIDSIKRTKEQQLVLLKWNGNSLGVESKTEDSYEIPSLDDFKIMNVSITQQPYSILPYHSPIHLMKDKILTDLFVLKIIHSFVLLSKITI